jgi:Icc-related predicted phosphoesterase
MRRRPTAASAFSGLEMGFLSKKKGNSFRLFFASDLHGSDRCFMKLVNAGAYYEASVVVCGGDLTGKMIVPLAEGEDGSVRARFMGQEVVARTPEEVVDLEKRLAAAGYYPHRTDAATAEKLDEEGVERLFRDVITKRLERWVAIADERLASSDVRFFWMAGNDDQEVVDEVLRRSKRLVFGDGRCVELLDGWQMLTLGLSNETPWNCPRDVSEAELARRIDELAADVSDFSRCIFNIHVPPAGTKLDQAPELDADLRPSLDAGGLRLANVGSTAVREAIERYSPALSLHGHIHESAGVEKLGQTVCVNPGSDYQEGVLRGALVVLGEEGGVRDWALTTG